MKIVVCDLLISSCLDGNCWRMSRKKERKRKRQFAGDPTSLRNYTPTFFQISTPCNRGTCELFLSRTVVISQVYKYSVFRSMMDNFGRETPCERENSIATLVFYFEFTQEYSCEYSPLDIDVLLREYPTRTPTWDKFLIPWVFSQFFSRSNRERYSSWEIPP